MSGTTCNCVVSKHPDAAAIDAALLPPEPEDPRAVAQRYGLSRTSVYEHRRHIGLGDKPIRARAASPDATPAKPSDAGRATHRDGATAPQTSLEPPATAAQPSAGQSDVSARSASVPAHSGTIPEKRAEGAPRVTTPSMESPTRAQPQVVDSTTIPAIPENRGTGTYSTAVAACAEAITRGVMRPAVLQGIGQKYGLTRDRVRQAYHEAARHLRLDMGGLLERQETSIAWVLRQRDEARTKAEARDKSAEDWRRKERESHEAAQRITDDEARIAALGEAARMGLVATKYGLEAEKWHASALAHQRHLDDVQCLVGPKEVTLQQFNMSAGASVAEFAAALARRFADRPEILAALDAAAGELERDPGDAAAIVTTGEAA